MSKTQVVLRQRVQGTMGDFWMGTPSGTYSTTGFACAGLVGMFSDDYFNDYWIHFYAGTHIGKWGRVTDYTDSTATFVITPELTGAVDATDLFELSPLFSSQDVNRELDTSIDMVCDEALQPKTNESIIFGSLTTDGLLETWTSSTELTNWTEGGSGTLTQESSVLREGTYSAKMVYGGAADCTLSQSLSNPMLYAGKSFTLRARCATNTADIARIRLYDGTTNNNSSYHGGQGWLESQSSRYLEKTGTIGTSPTEITVSLRVGGAGTVYWDKVWLLIGDDVLEYDVPTGFRYIKKVVEEDHVLGHFYRELNQRSWDIISDGTTPKLKFNPVFGVPTGGRKLRLVGYSQPSSLSGDASTTDINPAYLTYQAKSLLHQSQIGADTGLTEWHQQQMGMSETLAERERKRVLTTNTPGKKVDW